MFFFLLFFSSTVTRVTCVETFVLFFLFFSKNQDCNSLPDLLFCPLCSGGESFGDASVWWCGDVVGGVVMM